MGLYTDQERFAERMKRIPEFATAFVVMLMLAVSLADPVHAQPAPAPDENSAPTERIDRVESVDPWEGFNRPVHQFNQKLDRYIARPVARGYTQVVPRPLRIGISNFFVNLFQPLTAAHQILQGKPGQAASSVGRFSLNVVLGLGGIFDPATDAGIPLRQEDLGQTLAVWGWKDSRYLVLPFLGPSTPRDGFGIIGDNFANPYQLVDDKDVRIGLRALQLIDLRASFLGADQFARDVEDDYLIFRDGYLQRRDFQIRDGQDQTPDYLLEEFDFDDFDDRQPPDPAGDSATDDGSGRDD